MTANRKMSRKEREREFRKQAILEIAREVFRREGYANTAMAHIAELAELSVGTLYQSFTNKATLFAEVVLQDLEAGRKMLGENLPQDQPWEKQLQIFLEHYLGWARDADGDYMRTMIELYYSAEPEISPEVLNRFRDMERKAMEIVRDILMQSDKFRDSGVDPDLVAIILSGSLNAIYRGCNIGLLPMKPTDYIPQITGMLLRD